MSVRAPGRFSLCLCLPPAARCAVLVAVRLRGAPKTMGVGRPYSDERSHGCCAVSHSPSARNQPRLHRPPTSEIPIRRTPAQGPSWTVRSTDYPHSVGWRYIGSSTGALGPPTHTTPSFHIAACPQVFSAARLYFRDKELCCISIKITRLCLLHIPSQI